MAAKKKGAAEADSKPSKAAPQAAEPSSEAAAEPGLEAAAEPGREAAAEPSSEAAVSSGRTADGSYVVLARRYRPDRFEQVVGQEHVTRTLQNAIRSGRVHHAYLFTGSRGIGKTTVARILAKALNCESGATPDPCLECGSCQEIKGGASVDVFEIDGASHTGVDDVRELRESVRYLPARSRYKIYIIDEVHMLSTSAFNALLKTLEEPPPHVVFVLATTEPHKIPATILSRCQRFDFKRMTAPALVGYLAALAQQEGISVEQAGLSLIARASEGSMRDALSLLDQVIAYSVQEQSISTSRVAEVLGVADRRVLFALSRAVLARDATAALALIDELFLSGQDLSQFALAFLQHLRDLTVMHTCSSPGALVEATEAELAELEQQAGGAGAELLPQLFDRFAHTTEQIARSSFPRLLLEMAVVEMVHAEPLLPLGDLLQRLEGLEVRLGGGGDGGGKTLLGGAAGGGRGFSAGTSPRNPAAGGRFSPPPAASVPPVAPAPPPVAPAAAPASPEEAMARWQQIIQVMEARHPRATSAFMAGKLISWEGQTVLLGYAAGSFELQFAKDPDKRRTFETACAELTGQRLAVQVRELRPEEAALPQVVQMSAIEERERRKSKRARELKDEALSHPITRELVEKFGANIDSITTENDEP